MSYQYKIDHGTLAHYYFAAKAFKKVLNKLCKGFCGSYVRDYNDNIENNL